MIELELFKQHIGLDTLYTDEDATLGQYLNAATALVNQELGFNMDEFTDVESDYYTEEIPASIIQATLIAGASFYNTSRENEVVGSRVTELPFGVKAIISPYKIDFIGGII